KRLGRFFFSSRRRHTRSKRDWSSDVCSSDLDFDLDSPKATSDALRKVEPLQEWIGSRPLTQSEMEQLAWRHRLIERIVKYRRIRSEERRVGKECRERLVT